MAIKYKCKGRRIQFAWNEHTNMEWKTVKLGDILNFRRGHDLPHSEMKDGNIPVAGSNGCIGHHNVATPVDPIITIGRSGNVGMPYYYERAWAHNTTLYIDDFKGNNPKYLYYLIKTLPLASFGGGSAVPTLNRNHIHPLGVLHTSDKNTQNKIVSILSSLDAKIENNNRINANLEAQAQALYKSWFVDFEPWGGVMPEDWKEGKAEEFFEINIGKTPPRKEKEWFSTAFNKIWVSISDMANCGVFIADSSEYLTSDAVKKFNVVMVPQNTVLLSFKLTIGRVAIAQRELTTNEAIARFILPVPDLREYLYLYLHSFNYSLLGSTSSIATAVNSKIIKQMQMVMPTKLIINNFHQKVKPLFDQIATNQKESQRLAQLRDTLLPKLMKGEIEL